MMTVPVTPVFISPLVWLLMMAVTGGIGAGLARLSGVLRVGSYRDREAFQLVWIGYCVALALLQIWHLFLPTDWRAGAFLLALALFGVPDFFRSVRAASVHLYRGSPRLVGFLVVVVLWLALFSSGENALFDSELYHFSVVRASHEHPLIVGVGNLHDRFAFNNSTLLVPAAIETPYTRGLSFHFHNSFLWLVFALQCVANLGFLSRARRPELARLVSGGFLLIAAGFFRYHVPSHSTTFPMTVLGMVLALETIDLLSDEAEPRLSRELAFLSVPLVAAGAVAAKLPAIGLAVVGGLVGVGLLFFRGDITRVRRRALMVGSVGATLVIGFLCLRGVLMGGSVGYPGGVSLDVPWRIPDWRRELHLMTTQAYARTGAYHFELARGWSWVVPWATASKTMKFIYAPIGVGLLASGILAVAGRAKLRAIGLKDWLRAGMPLAASVAGATCGALVWFMSAPEVRYGSVNSWILASALVGLVFSALHSEWTVRWFRVGVVAVSVAAAAYPVGGRSLLRDGPAGLLGYAPAPVRATRPYESDFGVRYLIPADYFAEEDLRFELEDGTVIIEKKSLATGDAPFPSSAYPLDGLRYRRGTSVRGGLLPPPEGHEDPRLVR